MIDFILRSTNDTENGFFGFSFNGRDFKVSKDGEIFASKGYGATHRWVRLSLSNNPKHRIVAITANGLNHLLPASKLMLWVVGGDERVASAKWLVKYKDGDSSNLNYKNIELVERAKSLKLSRTK